MFDVWRTCADQHRHDLVSWLPGQGRYVDPIFITPDGNKTIKGYATDVITDLTLDFLEKRPKDQPFFLMYHHKAPHGPWMPGSVFVWSATMKWMFESAKWPDMNQPATNADAQDA